MLRSMYSGISGMRNFQTKLDVIGNNIANVNTYGFKKGRVTFKDTMNQTISGATAAQGDRGGQNPKQVGLGGGVSTIDTIHTQSSLQSTGRSLDLGISGDGYFVVRQGEALNYTRAGNFYLDGNGALVTGDGLKVQAYENGELRDISINVNAILPARETTEFTLTGNLPDAAQNSAEFTQQVKIVDSGGIASTQDVVFTKTGTSTWSLNFNSGSISIDMGSTPPTTSGTITGFSFNLDNLTNDSDQFTALANPDGNTEGTLESFSIGALGEISGVYSNGEIEPLGTLALAKFSNPSGLMKSGNNLFQESINSGTPDISTPGDGRGAIVSGSLEMSNVDLSEEFTEMIVAQRGFQANTRIITTSDEILQELVNLKR